MFMIVYVFCYFFWAKSPDEKEDRRWQFTNGSSPTPTTSWVSGPREAAISEQRGCSGCVRDGAFFG